MKTIILFSRCQLTKLYGQLYNEICPSYNVINLAYSDEEELILKNKYHIKEVINFCNEIERLYKEELLDENICYEIDELIISQSEKRFNLNSAIQSDRTFQYLEYNQTLLLCQIYYKFWNNLIAQSKADYMIHEPTSLFFNHIAALILRKNGSKYITHIQVYGVHNQNFMIVSGDSGKNDDIKIQNHIPLSKEEIERVDIFLKEFRNDSGVFFSQYNKRDKSFFYIIQKSLKAIYGYMKNRLRWKFSSISSSPLNHLNFFFYKQFSLFNELQKIWQTFLFVRYDDFLPNSNYYYYPIHLEPEAVVLYWGDGLYKNQIKLIENIAAQLPSNHYLYVKDHPHSEFYRNYLDYKMLKLIPNVRLLNPNIPGKKIIQNSKGVITINGTSGFEALLMKKQVYTFGSSYYINFERVNHIHHIRDLREILYCNMNLFYKDDLNFYKYVLSYLNNVYEGFTDYFMNYPELIGINDAINVKKVAKSFVDYFEKH